MSAFAKSWTLLKYGSQDGREYTEAAPPTEMEIMAGLPETRPRNCSECNVELQRGASGNESRDQPGKCINCAGDDSMTKAWETIKALPEQQQYTDLPALNEGFEEETPQHRVGTVNPAIIGMLERYRNATQYDRQGNPVGLPPKNMRQPAVLRTTGTSPSNPPLPRMIEAHSGRTGMPSRSHELYSTDYGQSPQANDMGIPGVMPRPGVDLSPLTAENMRVSGTLDNNIAQTRAPPAGSPQAMIDELYERDPVAAAALFNKAWDLLKNSPSPFAAPAASSPFSSYSPYTMDTGASARDSAIPEGTEDPYDNIETHKDKINGYYDNSGSLRPSYGSIPSMEGKIHQGISRVQAGEPVLNLGQTYRDVNQGIKSLFGQG